MIKHIFASVLFLCSFSSFAIDPAEMAKLLGTTGLQVEVHGFVPQDQVYVVTHRNPKDFFDYAHLSIVVTEANKEEFSKFKRLDKLLVWGKFLENPSPQLHLEVEKYKLVQKYDGHSGHGDYQYSEKFPEELMALSQAEFLVHNVSADGRIVVLEYKDHIVPMFVKVEQSVWTKNLYRNDIVRVKYKVQKHPEQPAHLRLDSLEGTPVEVLEAVLPKHLKPADIEGELILFPKSPQVAFDVFAVLERLPYGLQRQYTLVNFDNPDAFKRIREKLGKAWAADPMNAINGRNKFIHKKLRVRAKGLFNVVDANQANVQILLNDVNDIEIK